MNALFVLVPLAVLSVVVGGHWYLWRRLVRDVSSRGGWYRRTGTVLVFLLPLTTFAAVTSGRAGAPFAVERILAWPGFLWLALLLYLALALIAAEVVRPLLGWVLARRAARRPGAGGGPGRDAGVATPAVAARTPPASGTSGTSGEVTGGTGAHSGDAAPDAGAGAPADGPEPAPGEPSRRLFVARTLAAGAATAAAVTVGAGTYGVLNGPGTKRLTVPLAKLPRRAHGFRIAVVSDIHLGPILGRSHTRRIVGAINRTQPDLVAIVGDLVDGTVEDLGPAAEPLAALRSRHGTYFVTGNHEYFGDADSWIAHLRELGVRPLENAREELPAFDLAGVNDLAGEDQGEGPDFAAALGDRDTSRASVLLAHQPAQIHEAVDHGVDLQLSGHSHGGQLWPGNFVAALANPTVAGLERYGGTQLYVTRGAGTWGPPVRVGAESDITVVTLASRQA